MPGKMTFVQLKVLCREVLTLNAQIKELTALQDKKKAILIKQLGVGGALRNELFTCTIVQQTARHIPWKEIALRFARLQYRNKAMFRVWLRGIARAHPKKLKAPYALVKPTVTKEKS